MLDNKEIGKRLADARKSASLTQKRTAEYLGVQRETIAFIEIGSRPATTVMLDKLANLYGYKMSSFLESNRTEEEPFVATMFRTNDLSTADLTIIAEIKRIAINLDSMNKLLEKNANE